MSDEQNKMTRADLENAVAELKKHSVKGPFYIATPITEKQRQFVIDLRGNEPIPIVPIRGIKRGR